MDNNDNYCTGSFSAGQPLPLCFFCAEAHRPPGEAGAGLTVPAPVQTRSCRLGAHQANRPSHFSSWHFSLCCNLGEKHLCCHLVNYSAGCLAGLGICEAGGSSPGGQGAKDTHLLTSDLFLKLFDLCPLPATSTPPQLGLSASIISLLRIGRPCKIMLT